MEQENKYYTPYLSDFYDGYILEYKNDMQTNKWEHQIFDSDMSGIIYSTWEHESGKYFRDHIRTKYLDQSDIESCGWIKDWDENSSYSDCYKLITKSDISGQSDDEWVLWQYDKIVSIDNELSNRCFEGECKSINELRKIMNWLKIK